VESGSEPKPSDAPAEKRRHVRVAAQLQVDFTIVGGERLAGSAVTRDISHGGACLVLPGDSGALLDELDGLPLLDIAITGVAASRLRGRVEWIRHPETPGAPALVGIEFSDVSAADETAIIDLIAQILIKSQIGQPPLPSPPPLDTPTLLF
jgi:c-di-GMP-binding flagellar brake protein YcgR